jgi:hypothetical protein
MIGDCIYKQIQLILNYINYFIKYNFSVKMTYLILLSILFISSCNAEIFDFSSTRGLGWKDCEGTPWYLESGAIRSGQIDGIGASSICRDVQGPKIINFSWKIDAMNIKDVKFSFIDGKTEYTCNSQNWANFAYHEISDNKIHTIKWKFWKNNGAIKVGSGWIDNLTIADPVNQATIASPSSSSQLSPTAQSISSTAQQISSTAQQISPTAQQISPTAQQISPTAQQISPTAQQISPTAQQISPTAQQISPTTEIINAPKNILNNHMINLIWPEDGSNLSINLPIEFKFVPKCLYKVPLCTLVIDGEEIHKDNKSRLIGLNEINVFSHKLNELGMHSWWIKCTDCNDNIYGSMKRYFKIISKNNTTYVNKSFSYPSMFIYSSIKEAINNVSQGGKIFLINGVFNESVIIDKPLMLIGSKQAFIDLRGSNPDENNGVAIKIESGNVQVEAVNINDSKIGIQVLSDPRRSYEGINLINNSISNSSVGLDISNCINLTLSGNIIRYISDKGFKPDAIYLKDSKNIDILFNNFNNNTFPKISSRCSIYLTNCSNLNILRNKLYNSKNAICLLKTVLDEYELESNNTIDSSIENAICTGSCK